MLPAAFDSVRVFRTGRAVLELERWNPSGRYPIEVPWHAAEERELTPAEVVQCLVKALQEAGGGR